MYKTIRMYLLMATGLLASQLIYAQEITNFEEIDIGQDTFWNGIDQSGGFTIDDLFFPNVYNTSFGGYWEKGWALSSRLDSMTSDFTNLYGAKALTGHHSSSNYAVGQQNTVIKLPIVATENRIKGLYVTNTTYAHDVMRDGNDFATVFGGATGDSPDFFKLTIKKYENGALTTDSVEFYLADYRFEDNSKDYIVDTWEWVDLSSLQQADSLLFTLSSSDVGMNGINTPLFFAIDDILMAASPELPALTSSFEEQIVGVDDYWDGSDQSGGFVSGEAFYPNTYNPSFGGYWQSGWALSNRSDTETSGPGNLFSAKTGVGVNDSYQYAVGQQGSTVILNENFQGKQVEGMYITNTTYAYNSMRDGDDFAKKFGGETGDDPDFFKLSIKKWHNGNISTDSIDFYLADYRFEDNSEDYIIDTWKWVDLTALGDVDSLLFTLYSSDFDAGSMFINTPAFFAMDNLLVSNISSVKKVNNENIQIAMFPNPTTDFVQLDWSDLSLEQANISVFHINGQWMRQWNNVDSNTLLNVHNLAKGMYVVRLEFETFYVTKRLVVE